MEKLKGVLLGFVGRKVLYAVATGIAYGACSKLGLPDAACALVRDLGLAVIAGHTLTDTVATFGTHFLYAQAAKSGRVALDNPNVRGAYQKQPRS